MEPSPVADPAARAGASDERDPLLAPPNDVRTGTRKRFYRPRPLWLVPFAVTAALVRGMTLAPRVQVFTQLSCAHVYAGHNTTTPPALLPSFGHTDGLPIPGFYSERYSSGPAGAVHLAARVPHDKCLADPEVQAGAAQLQTAFMIIMGATSALSTGWWGQFGERYGRMKILAIATFGLFVSDLCFTLVSNPHSTLSPQHGRFLLTLAPFFEGILGGWASLQAAMVAYLSDCTSDGKSRAHVFSRFNGMLYVGFSLGPTLGAYFLRHPLIDIGAPDLHQRRHTQIGTATVAAAAPGKNVTGVFAVAAALSLLNLALVLFVFPESLHSKKPPPAVAAAAEDAQKSSFREFVDGFKHVAVVFAPRTVKAPGGKTRTDRSLTFLAAGLFFYLLALGIFQIKYLYAEHVYGWDSEQLSYYIFFAGGLRALALLGVLPLTISIFKPRPPPPKPSPTSTSASAMADAAATQRAHEAAFDLRITRLSVLIDVASHALVSAAPMHGAGAQGMFVAFSTLSSFASGAFPTGQSLALALAAAHDGPTVEAGRVFGAIGAVQAVSNMILGPLIFGVLYAHTVARHPKAIFNVACAIVFTGFLFLCFVRAPAPPPRRTPRPRPRVDEPPRGRSRRTKDLRPDSPPVVRAPRPRVGGYGAVSPSAAASGTTERV